MMWMVMTMVVVMEIKKRRMRNRMRMMVSTFLGCLEALNEFIYKHQLEQWLDTSEQRNECSH